MNKTLLILIIFCSISCNSSTKVNAKNEATAKNSIEEIKQSLSTEKKNEFENALKLLAFSKLSMKDLMSGKTNLIQNDILKNLDGKTVDEVIHAANIITKEREKKEQEQALIEIKELKNKKLMHEKEIGLAKSIKVVKSRYYVRKGTYSNDPIIELTIQNNTTQSLSKVYLEGTLSSPGRKVPWLVKDFNYEISGGAEPGETLNLNLAPNQYLGWTVDVKKDALFTVKVKGADDHNKKNLFGENNFSDEDKKRLKILVNKYQRKTASK